jgi:hypothetical protein
VLKSLLFLVFCFSHAVSLHFKNVITEQYWRFKRGPIGLSSPYFLVFTTIIGLFWVIFINLDTLPYNLCP